MRTITSITTDMCYDEDEIFRKFNVFMTNNRYCLVEGAQQWVSGNCCFALELTGGKIVIYSWLNLGLGGQESGIEKGFTGVILKKKMRAHLKALITIFQGENGVVEGYIPEVKGNYKVNTNVDTFERAVRPFNATKVNLFTALGALGIAVLNFIIIFATDTIYFYLPIIAIIIAAGAIANECKNSKKISAAVITLSIIAIVLAGISLLMYLFSLLSPQ